MLVSIVCLNFSVVGVVVDVIELPFGVFGDDLLLV